jgi:hypothetical protein
MSTRSLRRPRGEALNQAADRRLVEPCAWRRTPRPRCAGSSRAVGSYVGGATGGWDPIACPGGRDRTRPRSSREALRDGCRPRPRRRPPAFGLRVAPAVAPGPGSGRHARRGTSVVAARGAPTSVTRCSGSGPSALASSLDSRGPKTRCSTTAKRTAQPARPSGTAGTKRRDQSLTTHSCESRGDCHWPRRRQSSSRCTTLLRPCPSSGRAGGGQPTGARAAS